ncbi:lipocalin-like domain-containing protein [Edwardsiella tarda]|uniref:lipocalin-like domain-containing protein n=1 Tax=Edwardsiella tarda TaxID=636 RepID=UPI00098F1098|nr:lipocalin-like domain-containing protein [Edwardsiella tarda]
MQASDLYGTWRLLSFKHTILESGIESDIMGRHPQGAITFTQDHCVTVIITAECQHQIIACENSEQEKRLYENMMAYMARFELHDDLCDFYIDIAWRPSWVGLRLQRKITLQDDILTIDTLPQLGIDGKKIKAKLVWQKQPTPSL